MQRSQKQGFTWAGGPMIAGMLCVAATLVSGAACLAASRPVLRPPLWRDADDRAIPKKPRTREISELYAIVYNSWLRPMNLVAHVQSAADRGSLNLNAWDEVPDSSWFTNRIGRRPMTLEEIIGSIQGTTPAPGGWTVIRIEDEGYTPKVRIRDASGAIYVLKFDLPEKPERNSAAERICTLIMHAAGYHVPYNDIVYFRPEQLQIDKDSYYRDAVGKRRPMKPADLNMVIGKLKPRPDGSYRGLASRLLPGEPVGRFVYVGRRKDDPNDLIPHELRRELRGLRVIASWTNHADVKDANAMDVYIDGKNGGKYVKHYMLDFGSTLGSGDFVNGPYRVGHEYIYDGAATGHAFITLGFWQRPWEVTGQIQYPEVGYFQAESFEPEKWKPNYPNLAFLRSDDSDAYWGAKIVTAFSDDLIRRLAEEGRYTRPEVTDYIGQTLRKRRDAIGRYWLDRITPLEDISFEPDDSGGSLRFRDIALERGYAEAGSRSYRVRIVDLQGRERLAPSDIRGASGSLKIPRAALGAEPRRAADRFGRRPALKVRIQASRWSYGWALPIEVILGSEGDSPALRVLGWTHAPKGSSR